MGFMKIAGVIGIFILVFSIILIGLNFIDKSSEGDLLSEVTIIDWIYYFILEITLILSLIFFGGFYVLGKKAHNLKLRITSIAIIILLFILLIGSIFFLKPKADSNLNLSPNPLDIGGSASNFERSIIYFINFLFFILSILLIILTMFYQSLVDVYYETNVKYSRITGMMGSLCLTLILFFIIGIDINSMFYSFEELNTSLGGESSLGISKTFLYFYGFLMDIIYFGIILLMTMTLFSADKKFRKNNISIPLQTSPSLKPLNPPTQNFSEVQTIPQINPKNNQNISNNNLKSTENNFEIPKIIEREK